MLIPASMSDAEAGGFMVGFKTAYVALPIRTRSKPVRLCWYWVLLAARERQHCC
jgi:hypothetical protein